MTTTTVSRQPGRSETPRTSFEPMTWVVRWSHMTFTRPVPMIPRYEVREGDRICSSHYGAVYVTRTTADERPADAIGAVQFWMRRQAVDPVHSTIQPFTERYDDHGTVPLLARGDQVFGEVAGHAEAKRLWGETFEKRPTTGAEVEEAAIRVHALVSAETGGNVRLSSTLANDIVQTVLGR